MLEHEDAGALPRHQHSPRRLSAPQEQPGTPSQAEDERTGWRGMSPIPPVGARSIKVSMVRDEDGC